MAQSFLTVKTNLQSGPSNRDKTDDLVYWINQQYGVDPQALRLYLCTLLPMNDGDPAWVVADVEYHVFWRHLMTAITRLGGDCIYLTKIKNTRPRYANVHVDRITSSRGNNRLFVESNWREPFTHSYRHRVKEIEQEVMRRRIYCKPISPVPDRVVDDLTRRLYDWVKGMAGEVIEVDKLTDYQLTLCEIMGKIGPGTADSMSRNMAALAAQYRAGNSPIDEEEVQGQVYRTVVETVRPWNKRLIEGLSNGDGFRGIEQLAESVKGHVKVEVERMLEPWVTEGLVEWRDTRLPGGRKVRGRWIGPTPLGWEMIKLMRGEARWW